MTNQSRPSLLAVVVIVAGWSSDGGATAGVVDLWCTDMGGMAAWQSSGASEQVADECGRIRVDTSTGVTAVLDYHPLEGEIWTREGGECGAPYRVFLSSGRMMIVLSVGPDEDGVCWTVIASHAPGYRRWIAQTEPYTAVRELVISSYVSCVADPQDGWCCANHAVGRRKCVAEAPEEYLRFTSRAQALYPY